jgi:hypothetical protein
MKESEFYRLRRLVDDLHVKYIEQHKALAGLIVQIQTFQRIVEELPGFNDAFNSAKLNFEKEKEDEARRQKEGKKLSKRGDEPDAKYSGNA